MNTNGSKNHHNFLKKKQKVLTTNTFPFSISYFTLFFHFPYLSSTKLLHFGSFLLLGTSILFVKLGLLSSFPFQILSQTWVSQAKLDSISFLLLYVSITNYDFVTNSSFVYEMDSFYNFLFIFVPSQTSILLTKFYFLCFLLVFNFVTNCILWTYSIVSFLCNLNILSSLFSLCRILVNY